MHKTFGDDDLERALREKMPGGFEILMVHSSITHLQPMYDGDARSLLELMFRIAGPEATLAMPAFFFGTAELFQSRLLQKASQVRCPAYTFSDGPSDRAISSNAKCNASACRELCSTHHPSPWTFGEFSPFGIMGRRKTTILGLGVLLPIADSGPFDGGHHGAALSSPSS
jgi:aminoglycoside 3-N-acetyltransferase